MESNSPFVERDPWQTLGKYTSARIALGRTGGSLGTAAVLDFRLSHARARDAVQAAFSPEIVEGQLARLSRPSLRLTTAVQEKSKYLVRPDLGRQLSEESRRLLQEGREKWGKRDLAIIISDGLAAQAAERHAVDTLQPLLEHLSRAQWTIYPIFIVPLARVKVQDEIGTILGARQTLILLGERPGLGSPDSLSGYFTYRPHPARTDADRNCLSNIRPEGMPPREAADRLASLLKVSVRLQISGVGLKEPDRWEIENS